jgi:hypothetical protein
MTLTDYTTNPPDYNDLVETPATVSLGMKASYVEVLCASTGCSALPSIQARNSL